ncbi:hypothetical protein Tco_0349489 [Tanacetum coccineum]
MVSVTIHQDTSAILPMTSPVIDLVSRPDSPNVHKPLPTTTTTTATTTTTTTTITIMTTIPLPHQPQQVSSYSILINRLGELEQHIADLVDANQALEERLDKHGSRLYRLENQDIPNQVSKAVDEIVTDAIDWAMQAPLRERFRDLPEADMKEILHNRMWESKSYQTHEDHMTLYEALEKSMARDNSDQLLSDLAEARKKKKKRQGLPKTPPGSPPHIRILSVVRIVVFLMYGYNYMKNIVLHRADLKEYVIAERDFKYLYPSDFKDMYLLNLQGHLNHLSLEDKKILTTAVNLWTRNLVIKQRVEDFQLGIESYQTQLNLTKPRWDAKGFEYKHDFIVIDSPRAVTFRDKYGVQMIMRFNEINKFSNGTLQQIDEALDYRVKEFRVNRMNSSLDTRFWMKKDVDRSKEFMFAIQKRLKTRRIFWTLESFIGGRIREGDYRMLKRTV